MLCRRVIPFCVDLHRLTWGAATSVPLNAACGSTCWPFAVSWSVRQTSLQWWVSWKSSCLMCTSLPTLMMWSSGSPHWICQVLPWVAPQRSIDEYMIWDSLDSMPWTTNTFSKPASVVPRCDKFCLTWHIKIIRWIKSNHIMNHIIISFQVISYINHILSNQSNLYNINISYTIQNHIIPETCDKWISNIINALYVLDVWRR